MWWVNWLTSVIDVIETAIPLLLVFPLTLILIPFRKWIHKHEDLLYVLAIFLVTFITLNREYTWITTTPFTVIDRGGVSFALFFMVMFTGAFKRKTWLYKSFMQIRREMALLGFIFLIPHAVARLDLALNGFNPTGLYAMILMVPLVITSYRIIRRKIGFRVWKRVHLMAYLVYLFIYIHLGFNIFFNNGITISIAQNSVLLHLGFMIYLGFKIVNRTIPYLKKSI